MANNRTRSTKEMIQLRMKYLILLALLAEDLHGYEVMKRVKNLALGATRASPGTIYPLLHKLEEEGLVKSVEKTQGGRRIRVYMLTEKGIRELVSMVLDVLSALITAMRTHLSVLTRLSATNKMEVLVEAAGDELSKLRDMLHELEELLDEALEVIDSALAVSG
ncbi:MAG: PadR family transcriptional regulator [Pyrodictiaceae archaeon]